MTKQLITSIFLFGVLFITLVMPALARNRWRLGGSDYGNMVASPDGTFLVVWADGREGVLQTWLARVKVGIE